MSDAAWHHHHVNGDAHVILFCNEATEEDGCYDAEEYESKCEGRFWLDGFRSMTPCHFRLVWREEVLSEDSGKQEALFAVGLRAVEEGSGE